MRKFYFHTVLRTAIQKNLRDFGVSEKENNFRNRSKGMNVEEKNLGDVVQIFLDGRFDANTAPIAEEAIQNWIAKGCHKIVLDLGRVPFIASAGLRVVLSTTKELRKSHNGDLRVSSLQSSPAKVFEISGLTNVISLFDSADEAAEGF